MNAFMINSFVEAVINNIETQVSKNTYYNGTNYFMYDKDVFSGLKIATRQLKMDIVCSFNSTEFAKKNSVKLVFIEDKRYDLYFM